MITIYTDGSCDMSKKIGAWAAIIVDENGNETQITGQAKDTTSNRMELMAVLQGLFTLSKPSEVKIVTDSKYVEEAVNKQWLNRWIKDEEYDRPHFELWRILYNLLNIHDITIEWTRGHSGHEFNERCDTLATTEMKKFKKEISKKKDYYAVAVGKKVGIYKTWNECKAQVDRYPGAKYKKFDNQLEAEHFIKKYKKK